VAKLVKAAGS